MSEVHVSNKGDRQQVLNSLKRIQEDDDCYFGVMPLIWDGLSSAQREVLNQLLHTGPVFDGNIISKSARDDLIDYDLAVRCCFLGEDGYTAASYMGYSVFKAGKAEPFPKRPGSPG